MQSDIVDIQLGRKRFIEGRLVSNDAAKYPQQILSCDGNEAQLGRFADPSGLLNFARDQAGLREASRILNLRRIAAYAEEETLTIPDEIVSDEPIDPKWFSRWRQSAEDATSEMMRRLWARILAEEVKRPNSYSYRAIEFLASSSMKEANIIEKMASVCLHSGQVLNLSSPLDNIGLKDSDLAFLESLGIILGFLVGGIGLNFITLKLFNDSENDFLIRFDKKALVVRNSLDKPNFQLGGYNVTPLGKEIISLCNSKENEIYIRSLGKCIKDGDLGMMNLTHARGEKVYLGSVEDLGASQRIQLIEEIL